MDESKGPSNPGLKRELGLIIREAAPEIVQKLIVKAGEGSYLHAKFLFELAGLDLAEESGPGDGDESLAGYLLKELRESSGRCTATVG